MQASLKNPVYLFTSRVEHNKLYSGGQECEITLLVKISSSKLVHDYSWGYSSFRNITCFGILDDSKAVL